MFPNLSAILLGILLLTLQSSQLFPELEGIGSPDLFVALLTYLGLHRDIPSGAIPLVVLGFLADVYAATPAGLHLATSVIIFLLLQLLRIRLVVRGVGSGVVFAALATLCFSILIWILASIFVPSFQGGGGLLRFAFPRALLTAPFAIPVLWSMERLDRWGSKARGISSGDLSFGSTTRKT